MEDRPEGPDIAVVGSANVDLVVPVDVLPEPGQTVLGDDHLRAPGGKGANQAVAAAKLERHVALIGRVGRDAEAALLRGSLLSAGVDLTRLDTIEDVPTGIALITVDRRGENTIAVSPGANARLSVADVEAAAELLTSATVTLVQLEVPLDTVAAAVTIAEGTVVCNPAPAAVLPAATLDRVDVLVPNRSELASLAGVDEPRELEAVVSAVRRLPGDAAVVVTLGAEGALVVAGEVVEHVPAVEVDAVDATGAGDAFCAALADALSRRHELLDAVRWAVEVAGLATTRWGAQPGMPTRAEVLAARDRR